MLTTPVHVSKVALLMRTIAREFSQSRQKEGSRANMRDRGKVHRARNNGKAQRALEKKYIPQMILSMQ